MSDELPNWGLNRTAGSGSSSPPVPSALAALGSFGSLSLVQAPLRRNSVYGFEDRVVMDIGSQLLRVGLSGEHKPRHVLVITVPDPLNPSTSVGLYDLHLTPRLEDARREALTSLLSTVYSKYLLTDPKQRKVIVTDKALLPLPVKECIARILLDTLRVPAVQFVSSELMSLAALGRSSGLVVDIGALETTVVPVYDGRPLAHLTRIAPLGTTALHTRLDALLRAHATITPRATAGAAAPEHDHATLLAEALAAQPAHFLADLAARACFAAPRSSRGDIALPARRNPAGEWAVYDVSGARDATLHVEMPPLPGVGAGEPRSAIVIVPGWVRERAAEVWFEGTGAVAGEDDSIVSLVMDALVRLPLDARGEVAAGILVVGGGSMVSGVVGRIENELRSVGGDGGFAVGFSAGKGSGGRKSAFHRLDEVRRLVRDRSVVLRSLFKSNLLPWIGASLAGSVKMISSEITRDEFLAGEQVVPDWSVCYAAWQTYSSASTSGAGNGCNAATVTAIAAMTSACASDPEDAQWLSSTLPVVQQNLQATCSNAGLPLPDLTSVSATASVVPASTTTTAITSALAAASDLASGSTNATVIPYSSTTMLPLSAPGTTPKMDVGVIFLCVGFGVAGLIAGAVIFLCNRANRILAERDSYLDEEAVKEVPTPIRSTTASPGYGTQATVSDGATLNTIRRPQDTLRSTRPRTSTDTRTRSPRTTSRVRVAIELVENPYSHDADTLKDVPRGRSNDTEAAPVSPVYSSSSRARLESNARMLSAPRSASRGRGRSPGAGRPRTTSASRSPVPQAARDNPSH
ncbi:actin-domain-containing protein [Chytriomyces sp. MP71]|nr:actin-domain-containing protein [Chytriomyces sp. MP71]